MQYEDAYKIYSVVDVCVDFVSLFFKDCEEDNYIEHENLSRTNPAQPECKI